MNKKLEEFIDMRRKKGSCLLPAREEIMKMRANDVPFSAIQTWLENEYKINSSCENIRKFAGRYLAKEEEIWGNDYDIFHNEIGKIWVTNEDGEPYMAEEVIDV